MPDALRQVLLYDESMISVSITDSTGGANRYQKMQRRQGSSQNEKRALTGKEKTNGKKVGLWLDRRKAVIVSIAGNIEGRRIITSDMENYVLYSTVVPGDGSPEEVRDKRYWNHLGEYYEKIIEEIRDAVEIQIFGPEVAKFELQNHMESIGISNHIVSIEEAGKMTDLQIATKVLNRFPLRSRFDLS